MSVVDVDNLNMLKEVIGDDLKEVLDAYLMSTPDILNNLQSSIAAADSAGVQLHAHTLKGSAANVGANPLSQSCAQLEQLAKAGSVTPEFNNLFDKISMENQAVVGFLQNYMQQF